MGAVCGKGSVIENGIIDDDIAEVDILGSSRQDGQVPLIEKEREVEQARGERGNSYQHEPARPSAAKDIPQGPGYGGTAPARRRENGSLHGTQVGDDGETNGDNVEHESERGSRYYSPGGTNQPSGSASSSFRRGGIYCSTNYSIENSASNGNTSSDAYNYTGRSYANGSNHHQNQMQNLSYHSDGSSANSPRQNQRAVEAAMELQSQFKDLSPRERDRVLRDDLLILAPVVQEAFPSLPVSTCTYIVPYDEEVDRGAVQYMWKTLERWRRTEGAVILPLQTTGDGSCLLHAVSRGVWGVELFSEPLRHEIWDEISNNRAWYREIVGEDDVQEALAQAAAPHAFLGNLHIVALTHVLGRPVILFDSEESMLQYGCGYYGVAGLFGPVRLPREKWYPFPVVVCWANAQHNHFVPLVWSLGSKLRVQWPFPEDVLRERLMRDQRREMTRQRSGGGAGPPGGLGNGGERRRGGLTTSHSSGNLSYTEDTVGGSMRSYTSDAFGWGQSRQTLSRAGSGVVPGPQDYLRAPSGGSGGRSLSGSLRGDGVMNSFSGYHLKEPFALGDETRRWLRRTMAVAKLQEPTFVLELVSKLREEVVRTEGSLLAHVLQTTLVEDVEQPPDLHGAAVSRAVSMSGRSLYSEPSFEARRSQGSLRSFEREPSRGDSRTSSSPSKERASPQSSVRARERDSISSSKDGGALRTVPAALKAGQKWRQAALQELEMDANRRRIDVSGARSSSTISGGAPSSQGSSIQGQSLDVLVDLDAGRTTLPRGTSSGRTLSVKLSATGEAFAQACDVLDTVANQGQGMIPTTLVVLPPSEGSESGAGSSSEPATSSVFGGQQPAVSIDMRDSAGDEIVQLATSSTVSDTTAAAVVDPSVQSDGGAASLEAKSAVAVATGAGAVFIPVLSGNGLPGPSQPFNVRRSQSTSAVGMGSESDSDTPLDVGSPVAAGGLDGYQIAQLATQISAQRRQLAVTDATSNALTRPLPKDFKAKVTPQTRARVGLMAVAIVRLNQELRVLVKSPLPGISAAPVSDTNIFEWRAILEGPEGSAWEGKQLELEIILPETYPNDPPTRVRFLSKVYHPNVDEWGVPCIDFLPATLSSGNGDRQPPIEQSPRDISHTVGFASGGRLPGSDANFSTLGTILSPVRPSGKVPSPAITPSSSATFKPENPLTSLDRQPSDDLTSRSSTLVTSASMGATLAATAVAEAAAVSSGAKHLSTDDVTPELVQSLSPDISSPVAGSPPVDRLQVANNSDVNARQQMALNNLTGTTSAVRLWHSAVFVRNTSRAGQNSAASVTGAGVGEGSSNLTGEGSRVESGVGGERKYSRNQRWSQDARLRGSDQTWAPFYSISSVLLSCQLLLTEVFPDSITNPFAGHKYLTEGPERWAAQARAVLDLSMLLKPSSTVGSYQLRDQQ